jgi:hypothetical protein
MVLVVSVAGRASLKDVATDGNHISSGISEHIARGGTSVLFSMEKFHWDYSDTANQFLMLIFQARSKARVAVSIGSNKTLVNHISAANAGGWFDYFESRSEALSFLNSSRPMRDSAQYDHSLWGGMGDEVGPDHCKKCDRYVIRHSLFCRGHHYEMLRGATYIGDRPD